MGRDLEGLVGVVWRATGPTQHRGSQGTVGQSHHQYVWLRSGEHIALPLVATGHYLITYMPGSLHLKSGSE
jgi:hypothetical protein